MIETTRELPESARKYEGKFVKLLEELYHRELKENIHIDPEQILDPKSFYSKSIFGSKIILVYPERTAHNPRPWSIYTIGKVREEVAKLILEFVSKSNEFIDNRLKERNFLLARCYANPVISDEWLRRTL